MAKDPAFLFYPGDYLRDTQCLSESAQTAYDRIMCEHMRNICITQAQLNFFTKRLTSEQKSEVMAVLAVVPGGFQISWVAESIAKRRVYSESRRKNREGKGSKKERTYVPHMENEIVIENEDEVLNEYAKWTRSISDNNDPVFEPMLMNAHLDLTPQKFLELVQDHLELLNRYPKMRPPTQHAFRKSLLKHIRENKDKKVNGTVSKTGQHPAVGLAEDFARRVGSKPTGEKV